MSIRRQSRFSFVRGYMRHIFQCMSVFTFINTIPAAILMNIKSHTNRLSSFFLASPCRVVISDLLEGISHFIGVTCCSCLRTHVGERRVRENVHRKIQRKNSNLHKKRLIFPKIYMISKFL